MRAAPELPPSELTRHGLVRTPRGQRQGSGTEGRELERRRRGAVRACQHPLFPGELAKLGETGGLFVDGSGRVVLGRRIA